jgi:hypothetical protein
MSDYENGYRCKCEICGAPFWSDDGLICDCHDREKEKKKEQAGEEDE